MPCATRPHILVFELAKADALGGGASPAQQTAELKAELGTLGTVLGMDVLLNNWDRLPLIWDNEGNPGNLLVRKVGGVPPHIAADEGAPRLLAIDQVAVGLTKEHQTSYLEKVRQLCRALLHAEHAGVQHWARMRGCFAHFHSTEQVVA